MRTRSTLAVAVAALLCWQGSAVANDRGYNDPKLEFEKYTLDNGLEVILHRDNRVPLVAVNVWYHVGSGDEEPGKSGFAHLFEHMLFQGSEHVPADQHFAILKNIGATGVNGTTNSDRTNFFEVVPSNQIETALWLESDRMGFLLPKVTQESLSNQIHVVLNERGRNYENVPYGKTRFAIAELLYPEGHPLRYLTIGRRDDLEHASLEDVRSFYQKWYVPANATLVVAGDFEPEHAKELVEKWFGTLPRAARPPRQEVPMPAITQAKRKTVEDAFAKQRRIDYVWVTPAMYHPGDAELDLIGNALAADGVGRLYKVLVHDKQWAQSVAAYQSSSMQTSEFHLSVTLKPKADLASVEKVMNDELDELLKKPLSKDELARGVISMEKNFVWGLEGLMSRANQLQIYNQYVGDPGYISKDLDRWRKATPETVLETAKKYLTANKRVEVVTVPAKATGSATRAGKTPDARTGKKGH